MFNVFGDSTCKEGGLGNLQVSIKVIAVSGKYGDYVKEIQASHNLGYPAYRIASEGSPTFVFTYENKVFCFGAHRQHIYVLTPLAGTKTHYLAYSGSGGNATSINRGMQGKLGATGGSGPIGPHCPKGVKGDIGPSGGAGVKGDRGSAGQSGPKGERGVAGV